jgi:hypothetical protein
MRLTSSNLPSNQVSERFVLAVALVLVLFVLVVYLISLKRKINYERHWKAIQTLLANKNTWNDALIDADRLLDAVLKKRRYKGKTMGERLVAAQHDLKANDMVWYSHKLSNKVLNDDIKVSKAEVKKGLLGFWKALKDLSAFNQDKDMK